MTVRLLGAGVGDGGCTRLATGGKRRLIRNGYAALPLRNIECRKDFAILCHGSPSVCEARLGLPEQPSFSMARSGPLHFGVTLHWRLVGDARSARACRFWHSTPSPNRCSTQTIQMPTRKVGVHRIGATADGRGLQHGVEFRCDRFVAHGWPADKGPYGTKADG